MSLAYGYGLGMPYVGRAGGAAAWTPAKLSGAVDNWLWLDGADATTMFTDTGQTTTVTSDADAVASWADKSGNGYHYENATSSERPAYKTGILNGRSLLRFTGASSHGLEGVKKNMTRNVGKLSMFAVAKYTSAASETFCIAFSRGGSSVQVRSVLSVGIAGGGYQAGGRRLDTDGFQMATGGTFVSEYVIQEGVLDYANAQAFCHVDGVLVATDDPFLTGGTTADTDEAFNSVGWFGGIEFDGDIAEVLVVAGDLSADQRANIYSYLGDKW